MKDQKHLPPEETAAPKSKRTGRPREHKPTDETRKSVETGAAMGIPLDYVAAMVGTNRRSLERYYPEEIAQAKVKANAQVTKNLFELTKKNTAAAIFWLCNRDPANWRNTQYTENNNTHRHLNPPPDIARFNPKQMDILRQAAALLKEAALPRPAIDVTPKEAAE